MAPARIQLSRKKGFNLQAASKALNGLEAVNVARPTIFGNPVVVNERCSAKNAVAMFRKMLKISQPKLLKMTVHEDHSPAVIAGLGLVLWRESLFRRLPDLHGHNLACWCKSGDPCHADVLLELANPAKS